MRSSVRRLVAARFISEAGSTAALFVGVWGKATFRLDATPQEMALSAALWGIASIAGSVAGGILVDRFNPRRLLIAAEFIAVPATLSLIAAGSMPALIILVVPTSLASALIATAVGSFPPFIVEEESQLGRVNSSVEMAFALSFVAGPGAGAAIAKTLGLDWIFVANAVSSLLALALLAGVRIRPADSTAHGSVLREVREGIGVATRNGQVRVVLIIGLAVWLSFGFFIALEPLFYREVLHSGPSLLGWVLAIFGGGVFTGAALAARFPERWFSLRALALMAGVMAAGEIAYVGTSHLPVVIAGNIVWGVALGALNPVGRTIVHATTPETHVGRVMGTVNVAQRIGTLVPLTFVGALATSWGVQRVLVGSGVVLILFVLAILPGALSADRTRLGPVAAPPVPADPAEPEPVGRGLL